MPPLPIPENIEEDVKQITPMLQNESDDNEKLMFEQSYLKEDVRNHLNKKFRTVDQL